MSVQPAIAIDELKTRYEALGPIEELPGESTFLGRCSTFESFLEYGPDLADFLRNGADLPSVKRHAPGLADLALEAWQ